MGYCWGKKLPMFYTLTEAILKSLTWRHYFFYLKQTGNTKNVQSTGSFGTNLRPIHLMTLSLFKLWNMLQEWVNLSQRMQTSWLSWGMLQIYMLVLLSSSSFIFKFCTLKQEHGFSILRQNKNLGFRQNVYKPWCSACVFTFIGVPSLCQLSLGFLQNVCYP